MSQKHRADVDRKFIRRFLIISLGCFGFMLWGLFDSLVTSPKDLARALAFEKLIAQTESGELTEGQRSEKWELMCEENGWATAKPKAPKDARNYIYFQWFLFGMGLVLGLVFLWHYLRLVNAWVEGDQDGVESSWGQSLKFANIIEINKTKWEKKGIAKLSYTDNSGGKKVMVFDDFKFHRETMGKIMDMAESHLKDEQIVGGKRESEKAKELADQAQSADEEE